MIRPALLITGCKVGILYSCFSVSEGASMSSCNAAFDGFLGNAFFLSEINDDYIHNSKSEKELLL